MAFVANFADFNGNALCDVAAQFLALAEKHGSLGPLMVGHRLMGHSLFSTGNIVQGRARFDQSIALYDPLERRPLATRFGQDVSDYLDYIIHYLFKTFLCHCRSPRACGLKCQIGGHGLRWQRSVAAFLGVGVKFLVTQASRFRDQIS